MKPTLYLSGRQHANEVSSTNYILKLAELLATDKPTQEYLNGRSTSSSIPWRIPTAPRWPMNSRALTPFHSLHAGRYSALGLEIGTMTGSARPLLPEAAVKRDLDGQMVPGHLPEPPRLSVPRMGPAVLELFPLPVPGILDPQGLVRLRLRA